MNDNQNGFVTRSTSRVLAEPGGHSSFSLFGAPAPKNVSNDDSKRPDNIATHAAAAQDATAATTPIPPVSPAKENNDMAAQIKARNESSHFSLFGGSSSTTNSNSNHHHVNKTTPTNAQAQAQIEATNMVIENCNAAARIKQENEGTHFNLYGGNASSSNAAPTSSNKFASASSTNSYNVLTDRPTSRVIQEPGGASSIRLG